MNQIAIIEQETTHQRLHREYKERQELYRQKARSRPPKENNTKTIRFQPRLSIKELRERGKEQLAEWVREQDEAKIKRDEAKAARREARLIELQERSESCLERIALETAKKYEEYDVTLSDLFSIRRDVVTVLAKHECYWRAKQETSWSLPAIGRYFGGRDHTTILHGVRKYGKLQKYMNGEGPNPVKYDTRIPFELIIRAK